MHTQYEALPSPEVTTSIIGWQLGDMSPIEMMFTYTTNDPVAITLTFPQQPGVNEEVVWSFARNLLAEGLYSCAGIGDVCVEPAENEDFITVDLHSEDDQETFLVPREPIVDFINQTVERVPFGRESSYILHELNDFVDSFYVFYNLPLKKIKK